MKYFSKLIIALAILSSAVITGCTNSESYSKLVDKEHKAINAFLANQKVINGIPEDSAFIVGEDAPYYRIDDDGNVYMKVISVGEDDTKAEENEEIFFRYKRLNLEYLQEGSVDYDNQDDWEGNATLGTAYYSMSFRYTNYTLPSSSQYGSGIQTPLVFLPISCNVSLIIRSEYGFTGEISDVIPYVYNIKYYKRQI